MLRHKSDQKTFFDEVVGYYLPDNHFLKVNDIIDWTPIEKRLESLYDPQKRQINKEEKEKKEEAENDDTAFAGNVEGERQNKNKDKGFIGITKNGKTYFKLVLNARWTVKRDKSSLRLQGARKYRRKRDSETSNDAGKRS